MARTAVLLMGPTASGKTDIAIRLAELYPCDIISVDSTLVYEGMDIGTAKPDADTLRRAPHKLVNIREPEDSYSAGDFVRDATHAIEECLARERIPLLVGGTMMYFRALTKGIADLPSADKSVRDAIDRDATAKGWPALHAELAVVDPVTAGRLSPNDSQRIQRALEVFRCSGKPISEWQQESTAPQCNVDYVKIALQIEPRKLLHARIEERLLQMIEQGFVDEVRGLMRRPELSAESPSMRAVGYRQFWQYLDGNSSIDTARQRALFATRQLAKRQLTWLRSESELFSVNPLEAGAFDTISDHLAKTLVVKSQV